MSIDEMDFGADTDAIRKWLAKRATYADDLDDEHGGRHRVDPPGTIDPARLTVPNNSEAGKEVIEALVAAEPPVAKRWPAPYRPAPKPEVTKARDGEHPTPPPRIGTTPGKPDPYASTPEHEEELATASSTNAVFKPRMGARHTITAVLLVSAAMTVGAGYKAYQDGTNVDYGLTLLMALLTLVVWAVRASTSVTEMAVIRGQLEMIRNGRFQVIDLASIYTPVAVEGRAGHRGWRVLIERHDEPLLVIDGSMVNPHAFMAILHRVRPDLRPDAEAAKPAA
jgi:hypothetical protein